MYKINYKKRTQEYMFWIIGSQAIYFRFVWLHLISDSIVINIIQHRLL